MNSEVLKKIDELLSFLPSFSNTNRNFINESKNRNSIIAPFEYSEEVNKFVDIISNDFWTDHNYLENVSHEKMFDDSYIKAATLIQLKSLLTFFLRGERFCDGHWDELLRNGMIKSILERLKILRDN